RLRPKTRIPLPGGGIAPRPAGRANLRGVRTVLALIRATHPAPALVVTALATALGVVAGLAASTTVVLAVAVLAGQATIGWSNDLIDADRDRLAGRTDKPLATGHVSRTVVRAALIVALPVVLAASAVLGLPAASAHLVLLVAGWSYNAGLKATAASPLPYAVAFGALPAIPYLALDPAVMPPWWMMVVGALLGVGAHVVNVLPDLADDAATGVRGFPHRLGVRASGVFAVVVLLGGTTVG